MRYFNFLVVLLLISCSQPPITSPTSPNPSVTKSYLDSVPSGANVIYRYIYEADVPTRWTTTVMWMQAVVNPVLDTASEVEVAWMQLYSVDALGVSTLLVSTDYPGSGFSPETDGGLYSKYPTWFKVDTHLPMPATVSAAGILTFSPSSVPDSIWHWWTNRVLLPAGSDHIIIMVRIRISGGACIQMGADWWKTIDAQWCGLDSCNTAMMCSRWYFAKSDWQTLVMSSK